MNALLVCPAYADALWTYKHARQFIGKKASSPPIGLLTVAALLPGSWNLRFVDENVRPLDDADLAWAEIVLLGAMLAQQQAALQVIARAQRLGKRILAGGPLFCPELIAQGLFAGVDHIIVGEAEELLPVFLADLAAGKAQAVYRMAGFPDITRVPTPRWDLVDLRAYAMVNLQFVRGCPFDCEFCYGHVINGHTPRPKTQAQIAAELDALYAAGWRSTIFVCDDNLVGNHRLAREHLLPSLVKWMRAHDYPFTFTGAASLNLARDPEVMDLLVAAGFESVTLGIESPHAASLAEVHKQQNLNLDLLGAVHTILAHGLEVQSGMILGFDHDPPDIFEAQVKFVQASGMMNVLLSLLFAFPDTALYERLKRTGRLLAYQVGACVHGAINFVPLMGQAALAAGYQRALWALYGPAGYYERMEVFLRHYQPRPRRLHLQPAQVWVVLRMLFLLGVRDAWRAVFWKLLWRALVKGPDALVAYLRLAVMGYFLRQDIAEYSPPPPGAPI